MNTDLHLHARVQSAQKGVIMSEELATAIADAAELARLRMELDAARADNAALLEIAKRAHTAAPFDTAMADWKALNAEHPGTVLLAELDAARALIAAQQRLIAELRAEQFTHARLLGRCQEAFGIIVQATNAAACHRTARRMRSELEATSTKARTE